MGVCPFCVVITTQWNVLFSCSFCCAVLMRYNIELSSSYRSSQSNSISWSNLATESQSYWIPDRQSYLKKLICLSTVLHNRNIFWDHIDFLVTYSKFFIKIFKAKTFISYNNLHTFNTVIPHSICSKLDMSLRIYILLQTQCTFVFQGDLNFRSLCST